MRIGNERGEGRIGSIIGFLVLFAIAYSIYNLVPAYWNHYTFGDKLLEVARLPRHQYADDVILQRTMVQVHDFHLDDFIKPANCKITTGERSRRINCDYERQLKVLPGWTLLRQFSVAVDQPLLY